MTTLDDAGIRALLNDIFRDTFDDESIEVHDAMTAADVDEWDSLNHINLILAVERGFGVRFLTSEIGNLANVGEFIALLKAKLAART